MTESKYLSESSLPIAYEDRFLVVGLAESPFLAPHPDAALALGSVISAHLRAAPEVVVTLDFRGLSEIYNDVHDFVDGLVCTIDRHRLTALVEPEDDGIARQLGVRRWVTKAVKSEKPSFGWQGFDLTEVRHFGRDPTLPDGIGLFRDTAYLLSVFERSQVKRDQLEYVKSVVDDVLGFDVSASDVKKLLWIAKNGVVAARSPFEEITWVDALEQALLNLQFEFFSRALHRHSMLVEFTIQAARGSIEIVPYHASACYGLEHPCKDDLLIGRPAVLAARTRGIFAEEIRAFESLLSAKGLKERAIQRFLEEHPHFLQGLNYTAVHSHVVLERDDGTSLCPDFLLEPRAGDWCDILDLKLPTPNIFVGRRDRVSLAAAITDVAAQLREYSAYFEDERHRKMVLDRYGLRTYRPKLIAVVGRDADGRSTEQHRRASTVFPDLEIMTFDRLLDIARSRILL